MTDANTCNFCKQRLQVLHVSALRKHHHFNDCVVVYGFPVKVHSPD